jgi:hypothetical protein
MATRSDNGGKRSRKSIPPRLPTQKAGGRKLRTLLIWLFLLLISLMIARYLGNLSAKATEITYTEYLQLLKDRQIKEAENRMDGLFDRLAALYPFLRHLASLDSADAGRAQRGIFLWEKQGQGT